MASGRRGGPPDLKSTLGSLLRTTLEQVGAVKDAVEQHARGQGGLINQALVQRRRNEAMAKLGETVHRLARSGELGELALDPSVGMCLQEIDALDEDAEFSQWPEEDDMSSNQRGEAVSSANYAPARTSAATESGEYRVWRPTLFSQELVEHEQQAGSGPGDQPESRKSGGRSARLSRKVAQRSGSAIRFVEDKPRPEDPESEDDLASYMHDDDVPEKE